MKALVFGVDPQPWDDAPGTDAPRLLQHLAATPMALQDVADPAPIGPDWVVLRTRMTGICGSDAKQVLMDFEGGDDNPMTAFISFPQVLGHEVVADVVEVGPEAKAEPGQRVVLNPWLSCGPRGIDPWCGPCQAGDLAMCEHFLDGRLSPGIHTGNCVEATGGFAELLPAHDSMCIPVPEGLPDEVAVLADPFAVSLHGIVRNPPPEGGRVLVYGMGALGTTAVAVLRALYPSVEIGVVAMWPAQRAMAERLGASRVLTPEPREELIEELAEWSGGVLRRPWGGLPVAYPGRIDVVYDTIGGYDTVEVGIRVLASRGTLVQLGVNSPKRLEWTPIYFKELRWVGSSAFGVEDVDGVRRHAIAHYLDMAASGRVDLSGMLTHTFGLDDWRHAFTTIVEQGETGAIKVAFDFRTP